MKKSRLLKLAILAFIAASLVGCTEPFHRSEVGVGVPLLFPKTTNSGSGRGKSISLFHSGFYVGDELFSFGKYFKFDGLIGASTNTTITDDTDFGIATEIMPRFRFTYWNGFQPYFVLSTGVTYFPTGIRDQGTDYGFILGGGPGAKFLVDKGLSLVVEWRAWHESNGRSIWQTHGPNFGYNSDLLLIGIEKDF